MLYAVSRHNTHTHTGGRRVWDTLTPCHFKCIWCNVLNKPLLNTPLLFWIHLLWHMCTRIDADGRGRCGRAMRRDAVEQWDEMRLSPSTYNVCNCKYQAPHHYASCVFRNLKYLDRSALIHTHTHTNTHVHTYAHTHRKDMVERLAISRLYRQ